MQLYILHRDEASRFTDFGFINGDVHKISIHSQYLSNHWRYRHVIWAKFRLDAALYLAQRWSFTVHWLWFIILKKYILRSFKIFFGDILFADPNFCCTESCLLLKGSHLWNKSHGEHHFLNDKHPKNLFFMDKIIFLGDILFAEQKKIKFIFFF